LATRAVMNVLVLLLLFNLSGDNDMAVGFTALELTREEPQGHYRMMVQICRSQCVCHCLTLSYLS
jgi:hypothetical protein